MNIEFKPKQKIEVVSERAVYVDGARVGYINEGTREDRGARFHVVFEGVPGGPSSLVQGHGETEHEAVVEAISLNRKAAMDRLQALEDLQFKLFGSLEMVSNG